MFEKVTSYVIAFIGALALTLVLTPVVREINRKLGIVDKPDARRINKVPIPRGGGLALVFGLLISYALFHFFSGRPWIQGVSDATAYKMTILSIALALWGYADDRWSLSPKLKLFGQVVVAFLVWWWVDLGFADLWPSIPLWLDCALTMFWVVGAVNAFNLIDGMDGLASGLALIAILGMACGLFFAANPQASLFYVAFAGALLGFLHYNFYPASVFLGDSGSMFIGFMVSTLPLASHAPNSFLISVGVPLLAMGVPIFDTALAILRRSIRRLLAKRGAADGQSSDGVMTADSDHLHHRILRAMGMNQRRAAWVLYAMAVGAVVVGLFGAYLRSRAAGLWLLAIAIVAVIAIRDMATIELYDAGRLLNALAKDDRANLHRRWARLRVPCCLIADLILLGGVFYLCSWALRMEIDMRFVRMWLPIRIFSTFACLVLFGTYSTLWSRAMPSNYLRLLLACLLGSAIGSVVGYYMPKTSIVQIKVMTIAYASASFVALMSVRMARGIVRDLFYAVDCARLKGRKDVSRILVYGAGLRYRAFRRELVRTTSANDRMIVGLLDDDVTLRGKRIGGIRIMGTILEAPEIINAVNADAVVITCDVSDERRKAVIDLLQPTGVKITHFKLGEIPLKKGQDE